MFEVLIKSEDGQCQTQQLAGKVRIGRDRSCEIRLGPNANMVSRFHATLEETPKGVLFTDEGSTNGSSIDEVFVDSGVPTLLRSGQTLQVGEFILEITLEEREDGQETVTDTPATPQVLYQRTQLLDDFESLEFWDGSECELVVDGIRAETAEANTYRLMGQSPMLFSYSPGQSIGICVEIDGKKKRRSYSISSSPSRPHCLEITVKREPDGLVSNWLADNITVGDSLLARGPKGKFSTFNHPSPKLLLLAAGVGITPLLSMMRWIVDSGAPVDVVLIYTVQTPEQMIFRRELEAMVLVNANIKMFTTATQATGGHGWPGFNQRLTSASVELAVPDFRERETFLCGPSAFGASLKEQLVAAGLPAEQFHEESFGGRPAPKPSAGPVSVAEPPARAKPKRPEPAAPKAATPKAVAPAVPAEESKAPGPAGFNIHFAESKVKCNAPEGDTVLEIAEESDLDLDYSCRQGTCGTCIVKCTEGSVTMDEHGLSKEELAEGWIYACVSHPQSNLVIEA